MRKPARSEKAALPAAAASTGATVSAVGKVDFCQTIFDYAAMISYCACGREDRASMSKQLVLVTGPAGYIGCQTMIALTEAGHDLVGSRQFRHEFPADP